MNMRPKQQARFMMEAELQSMWSTCKRLQVGTTVVDDDGAILVSVYNGAPYGQPHCQDRAEDQARCTVCCHSETNAGNQAAKTGIKLAKSHMYTLYRPCDACAKNIVQVGYRSVFYRYDYDTDGNKDYVINLLCESGIYTQKLEPTLEEKTFSSILREWRSTWAYGSPVTPSPLKLNGM